MEQCRRNRRRTISIGGSLQNGTAGRRVFPCARGPARFWGGLGSKGRVESAPRRWGLYLKEKIVVFKGKERKGKEHIIVLGWHKMGILGDGSFFVTSIEIAGLRMR